MTPEEIARLNVTDFRRIHDGLEVYAGLSAKQMMERLTQHKEDAFCEVTDFSGTGRLQCTFDAYDAIFSLAERHLQSVPVPGNYSVDELAAGIRKYIVHGIVEKHADELVLDYVLDKAVAEANLSHVERTFHLPCVLVGSQKPAQFRVGPIIFTAASEFPEFMAEAFRRYVSKPDENNLDAERVANFKKHILTAGWVATVTVPPCAESVAEKRADESITAAINLSRLLIGVGHARDIRLAHAPQGKPTHTEHAVEINSVLDLYMTRRVPGVSVDDGWHLIFTRYREFWRRGGALVHAAIKGEESEITRRLLDALSWFGEAAFEQAPGTQIVKFVVALERLVTTEKFNTPVFCARVAYLARTDDSDFERCYWNADAIYNARCRVVHGNMSATSRSFQNCLLLAHDLTRNALFRSLELHSLLDSTGPTSTLSDLHEFFTRELAKKENILAKLRIERKTRAKHADKG